MAWRHAGRGGLDVHSEPEPNAGRAESPPTDSQPMQISLKKKKYSVVIIFSLLIYFLLGQSMLLLRPRRKY